MNIFLNDKKYSKTKLKIKKNFNNNILDVQKIKYKSNWALPFILLFIFKINSKLKIMYKSFTCKTKFLQHLQRHCIMNKTLIARRKPTFFDTSLHKKKVVRQRRQSGAKSPNSPHSTESRFQPRDERRRNEERILVNSCFFPSFLPWRLPYRFGLTRPPCPMT